MLPSPGSAVNIVLKIILKTHSQRGTLRRVDFSVRKQTGWSNAGTPNLQLEILLEICRVPFTGIHSTLYQETNRTTVNLITRLADRINYESKLLHESTLVFIYQTDFSLSP